MKMRAEPALTELERLEWRVLGALRPTHAVTGNTIRERLEVTAEHARIVPNLSGLWVIHEWSRLAEHATAFAEPPAQPAEGTLSLDVEVRDPRQHYLPRRVAIALPRNPQAEDDSSLFVPVDVPLYPSPDSQPGINWCTVRAVVSSSGGDRLGGALLRVLSGTEVLARGVTDWRGEAMVPVAGVPVTTWSEGDGDDVVATEVAATLHAYFDATVGTRLSAEKVLGGYLPERGELPLVNPDDLEGRRNGLPTRQEDISLAARGKVQVDMVLDLT